MLIIAVRGGNASTETFAVVVRRATLGVVGEANARTVLMKELMVGALNGVLWAVTVAIVTVAWHHNYKVGVDPAVASGVILTTVTDVVGFFAFWGWRPCS